jgi:uncharacterized protein
MTQILHIDVSPRGERSVSRMLAQQFISDWQAAHPNDTIIYRDLGHDPVPVVSEAWIAAAFMPPEQRSPESAEAIRFSDQLVDQFLSADRILISMPMYNFSIPASFKAYLDQILRAGRTFAVGESGYTGLVQGKQVLFILAQGGSYPADSPAHAYDLQTPYLRLIFGFMGITDLGFVYADNLMADDSRQQAIAKAQILLRAAATQSNFTASSLVADPVSPASEPPSAAVEPNLTEPIAIKTEADQSVTAVISHVVRPGREQGYEAWFHGIAAEARKFSGHLGVTTLCPRDHNHPEYVVILKFDCYDNLKTWLESGVRRDWIERLQPLIEKPENIQTLTGLETWFSLPNQLLKAPPPRYKMALITWLGVFVTLAILTRLLAPLLTRLPLLLSQLLSSGLVVALLTYLIMPRLTRLFRTWLYPAR